MSTQNFRWSSLHKNKEILSGRKKKKRENSVCMVPFVGGRKRIRKIFTFACIYIKKCRKNIQETYNGDLLVRKKRELGGWGQR